MNLPARDDLHLLAGAYALDALDDIERRRFEQHLDTCASCRADVAGFLDATAALADAAAASPPASMRAAVMRSVGESRQMGRRPVPRRRSPIALAAVAMAAAMVVIVLSAVVVGQRRENDRLSARAAIVEAADARITHLVGQPGSVAVTFSASRGGGVLVADGLPPTPTGKVYELWFIEGGAPMRSITFQTNPGAHAVVMLDRLPPAGSMLAITEEPAGGSDAPTSPPTHISPPI